MKNTQCQRILAHLKQFGSITPMVALSEYGIMRLASRINDIRGEGVGIERVMTSGVNRFGEKTRYATYYLKGSQNGQGA